MTATATATATTATATATTPTTKTTPTTTTLPTSIAPATPDAPVAEDPIPAVLRTVLELFGRELAAVRFGDLDRAVLDEAAVEVRRAAAEVTRIETELAAARTVLDSRLEALRHKAQRALSYARIFAEDDPALRRRLEALDTPDASPSGDGESIAARSPGVVAARRRRRPSAPASPALFDGDHETAALAAPR